VPQGRKVKEEGTKLNAEMAAADSGGHAFNVDNARQLIFCIVGGTESRVAELEVDPQTMRGYSEVGQKRTACFGPISQAAATAGKSCSIGPAKTYACRELWRSETVQLLSEAVEADASNAIRLQLLSGNSCSRGTEQHS
jgi:hypothetical protein